MSQGKATSKDLLKSCLNKQETVFIVENYYCMFYFSIFYLSLGDDI